MSLTFLVPTKLESEDRVRNLTTILTYLLSKFDHIVSVQECDREKKFEKFVLPSLVKKFGENPPRLQYTFDRQKTSYFHKTRILNDLLERSTTEVVCNYDVDALLPESSINQAYDMIQSGQWDAVYPYGCGIYQRAVTYAPETYESFINSDLNVDQLDKYSSLNNSTIGWCQFVRRKNYIESFMMNENFQAWGPEDCEFYYRLNALGNRVGRVNDYVYHLEHSRSTDSWFTNPAWQDNTKLWHWIRTQPQENLIQYMKNQDYVRRRMKNVSL